MTLFSAKEYFRGERRLVRAAVLAARTGQGFLSQGLGLGSWRN